MKYPDNPAQGKRKMSFAPVLLTAIILLFLSALPAHASDRALVSHVNPVCPEIVKRMHINGIVKMMVTVNADGAVTDVQTVDGVHLLATVADQAIHKWKYEKGTDSDTFEVIVHFSGN